MKNFFTVFSFLFISLSAFAGKDHPVIPTSGNGRGDRVATEMVSIPPAGNQVLETKMSRDYSHFRNKDVPQITHIPCGHPPFQLCDAQTPPMPYDTLKTMYAISRAPISIPGQPRALQLQEDCNCYKNELAKNKTDAVFDDEKKAERVRVNKKILEGYSRKFINSFAQNLEDVSFYSTQVPNFFSSAEVIRGMQCNDQGAFNDMVEAVCDRRGITDKVFIQGRKDLFINSMSQFKGSFETRLDVMSREILSMNIRSEFEGSEGNIYTRQDYDYMRRGLARRSEKGSFVDGMMSGLMRLPEVQSQIANNLLGNASPYDAIFNVLKSKINDYEFVRKLGVGRANWDKYIKNEGDLHKTLGFLMTTHPGFMNVMRDKEAFTNLQASFKEKPERNLLDHLEFNPKVVEPILKRGCDSMIQDFANAVCTSDDNLIASVEPDDLDKLLHEGEEHQDGPQNVELHELLICEGKRQQLPAEDVIANLSNFVEAGSSDYLNRLLSNGKPGLQTGSFQDIGSVIGGGGTLVGEVTKYTDLGAKDAPRVAPVGSLAAQVHAEAVASGRVARVGSSANRMSRGEASKYLADSKALDSRMAAARVAAGKSSPQSESTQAPAIAANDYSVNNQTPASQAQVTAPVTNQTAVQVPQSNYTSNAKEALRNYIADKDKSSEATAAVNNLDDESVQELYRLRNENKNLLEQTLKAETAKYEDMKAKLDAINSKAPVPSRTIASNAEDTDNDSVSDNFVSGESSSGRIPKSSELRNVLSATTGGAGQSQVSVSGTQSQSAAKKIADADKSEMVNSNDIQNPSTSGIQSQSSGLVISTNGVKTGAIQPQEINLEVQKLLASSDLKASAIQDIKTKGILFKYSVMENNKLVQKEILVKYENLDQQTRNAIDLKLARKTAANQVSKLAVLKLLIGQNPRR